MERIGITWKSDLDMEVQNVDDWKQDLGENRVGDKRAGRGRLYVMHMGDSY